MLIVILLVGEIKHTTYKFSATFRLQNKGHFRRNHCAYVASLALSSTLNDITQKTLLLLCQQPKCHLIDS